MWYHFSIYSYDIKVFVDNIHTALEGETQTKKEKVDIGKTIRKTWNNWGLGHISLIRETKIQDLRLYTSPVIPLCSVTLNKPITLPGSWVLLSLKWMDQKTNSLPALKHVEYFKDANKTS